MDKVEQEHVTAAKAGRASTTRKNAAKVKGPGADPLDGNLWGMRMIKADQAHTPHAWAAPRSRSGSWTPASRPTTPTCTPTSTTRLSRNFVTDIRSAAVVDGPCESPHAVSTRSATDDGGHGTHVAGHDRGGAERLRPQRRRAQGHASSRSRAGQDSGYFFARPDGQRAHLLRRRRPRRGEHVVLRRPVALQLPRAVRRRTAPTAGHTTRT